MISRKIAIDEIDGKFAKDFFSDEYDLGYLVGIIHAYSVAGAITDTEYMFLINAVYAVVKDV